MLFKKSKHKHKELNITIYQRRVVHNAMYIVQLCCFWFVCRASASCSVGVKSRQAAEISTDKLISTGLRERHKREKSEQIIDCHHQDSNHGPSLVAGDALTAELWYSRHPSRDRSTFSSDFVTHTSCESTQAGGTQPSLHVQTSTRGAPSHNISTGLRERHKRERSEE